jgi:hypothetical protein
MSGDLRLKRWMGRPWFLTMWCVVAAFGTYACMYGFRKPFTAAGYGGAGAKAWLVTAQVMGYMVSKFIGIKVIAEMEAAIGWLERNRLTDHLHLVRDDPRYAFTERRVAAAERRRLAEVGQPVLDVAQATDWWRPPVGRPASAWTRRRAG